MLLAVNETHFESLWRQERHKRAYKSYHLLDSVNMYVRALWGSEKCISI